MKIDKYLNLISHILLVVTAGWMLAHLILIENREYVVITESNPLILWFEIIVVSAWVILGIERATRLTRRLFSRYEMPKNLKTIWRSLQNGT